MHDDLTFPREVHVELDPGGPEGEGALEGGQGVLDVLARCPAVADELRLPHAGSAAAICDGEG